MGYKFAPSGIPKYKRIIVGAIVCNLLKQALFNESKWNRKLCDDIGLKFNHLKAIMRNSYPNSNDEQILDILRNWSKQDIEDVFCASSAMEKKEVAHDAT